jgi:hypothetical protein
VTTEKEKSMTEKTNRIARRAGDKFEKDGKLLTADELLATVEEDYAKAAEDAELDRELELLNCRVRSHDPATLDVLKTFKAVDENADSVDGVTADSAKLHLRALEVLKEQGKGDDYTADEYMLAIEQVQEAS